MNLNEIKILEVEYALDGKITKTVHPPYTGDNTGRIVEVEDPDILLVNDIDKFTVACLAKNSFYFHTEMNFGVASLITVYRFYDKLIKLVAI